MVMEAEHSDFQTLEAPHGDLGQNALLLRPS